MSIVKKMLEQINHILFWNGILWLLVYGYIVFFNKGIPNIETAPAVRKKLIDAIRADITARGLPSYRVVDVGSGSGSLTRELAAALPHVQIIGIEINAYSVYSATRRKEKQKLHNLEYRKIDFMAYDFSEVDAIIMFLLPGALTMIGPKLQAETRPGTLITANKFQLPGWTPTQIISVKSIYLKGDLYLYQK